jgi:hypothetical protein
VSKLALFVILYTQYAGAHIEGEEKNTGNDAVDKADLGDVAVLKCGGEIVADGYGHNEDQQIFKHTLLGAVFENNREHDAGNQEGGGQHGQKNIAEIGGAYGVAACKAGYGDYKRKGQHDEQEEILAQYVAFAGNGIGVKAAVGKAALIIADEAGGKPAAYYQREGGEKLIGSTHRACAKEKYQQKYIHFVLLGQHIQIFF